MDPVNEREVERGLVEKARRVLPGGTFGQSPVRGGNPRGSRRDGYGTRAAGNTSISFCLACVQVKRPVSG